MVSPAAEVFSQLDQVHQLAGPTGPVSNGAAVRSLKIIASSIFRWPPRRNKSRKQTNLFGACVAITAQAMERKGSAEQELSPRSGFSFQQTPRIHVQRRMSLELPTWSLHAVFDKRDLVYRPTRSRRTHLFRSVSSMSCSTRSCTFAFFGLTLDLDPACMV